MLKKIYQQLSENRKKLSKAQKIRLFFSIFIGSSFTQLMDFYLASKGIMWVFWQQIACVFVFTTLIWWVLTWMLCAQNKDFQDE